MFTYTCHTSSPPTVSLRQAASLASCEPSLRNDLCCVEWGVKLYSNSNSQSL